MFRFNLFPLHMSAYSATRPSIVNVQNTCMTNIKEEKTRIMIKKSSSVNIYKYWLLPENELYVD